MKIYSLKSKQVGELYKTGKKIRSDFFLVYYLPKEDWKLCYTISKKVLSKAVQRNKLRRWCKNCVRELARSIELEKKEEQKAKQKFYINIVFFKKESSFYEQLQYPTIQKELQRVFNKLP